MGLTVSAALGTTYPFSHKGKDYEVSLVTRGKKIAYEKRLMAQAQQGVLALRDATPDEEWRKLWDELTNRIAAGVYRYHGRACSESLKTEEGALGMAALLFGCDEEEMTMLLLERGPEVNALLKIVYAESVPDWAKAEKQVPNSDPLQSKVKTLESKSNQAPAPGQTNSTPTG